MKPSKPNKAAVNRIANKIRTGISGAQNMPSYPRRKATTSSAPSKIGRGATPGSVPSKRPGKTASNS